jgi:RNA polymerase-binding protein DksA
LNSSRVYGIADSIDIASNHVEHNTIIAIAQSETLEINQIDNALKKIKQGKYGMCECCGSNINKQRLVAIPFVSLCVKCKELEERDEGIMSNRTGSSECEEFEEVKEEISNVIDDKDIKINQFDN